jgi:hypothetical protein
MKKLLFLIIAILSIAGGNASEKNTVIMPLLISRADSSKIGDKTDEISIKKVQFSKDYLKDMSTKLIAKLSEIENNDAEHYVFIISINIDKKDKNVLHILVFDHDIMSENEGFRKSYYGDLQIGEAHFIVTQNPLNKELVNKLFEKAGDNNKFIREYEYAEEPPAYNGTNFVAEWNGKDIIVTEYKIDNEDQLNINKNGNDEVVPIDIKPVDELKDIPILHEGDK